MNEKMEEFFELLLQKDNNFIEEKFYIEGIESKEKFLEYIKNWEQADINEVLGYLYKNNIKIEDIYNYLMKKDENKENVKEEYYENIDDKQELIIKKIDELKTKIKIINEKVEEIRYINNERVDEEVSKTIEFLKELRKTVDDETKIYSNSLLISVEENFKNLSNIISSVAEKFIDLNTNLNNDIILKNSKKTNENNKNSSKIILGIFLAILLFAIFKIRGNI